MEFKKQLYTDTYTLEDEGWDIVLCRDNWGFTSIWHYHDPQNWVRTECRGDSLGCHECGKTYPYTFSQLNTMTRMLAMGKSTVKRLP